MVYARGRVESQGTKIAFSITYLPPTIKICTIKTILVGEITVQVASSLKNISIRIVDPSMHISRKSPLPVQVILSPIPFIL